MKPGPYEFLVCESCDHAYRRILRDAARRGITQEDMNDAIAGIRDDCDQGRLPSDTKPIGTLDNVSFYSHTIHGYSVHFTVDEDLKVIKIRRFEEP